LRRLLFIPWLFKGVVMITAEANCKTLSVKVLRDGEVVGVLTEREAWDLGMALRSASLSVKETAYRIQSHGKKHKNEMDTRV
jgi:hypothetical protein